MQNEIFFDILEELDCIIDTNGAVLKNDVRGVIQVRCQLSGTPDLTLVRSGPHAPGAR
jgi:AP-3 complex subunit mu